MKQHVRRKHENIRQGEVETGNNRDGKVWDWGQAGPGVTERPGNRAPQEQEVAGTMVGLEQGGVGQTKGGM